MAKIAVPLQEKMLLNIEEVGALLGIGRDLVYHLLLDLDPATQKPRLHSTRVGRRRLVSRRSLEVFISKEV